MHVYHTQGRSVCLKTHKVIFRTKLQGSILGYSNFFCSISFASESSWSSIRVYHLENGISQVSGHVSGLKNLQLLTGKINERQVNNVSEIKPPILHSFLSFHFGA